MADNEDVDSFSEEEDEESDDIDEDSESDSEDSENESDMEVVEDEDIAQQVEVPKDIKLNSPIIEINCHPKKNILAAGTINGTVHLYSFDKETENKEIETYEHHKKYCRAVKFSPSGEYLFTGSQDAIIYRIDVEANSDCGKLSRTGGSPLYSLLPIDNYLLAAGEDDGQVVIWDFSRMPSPVAVFEDCSDYISCLAVNKDKTTLLATGGEGVLASYDIKSSLKKSQHENNPKNMQSDCFNDAFLSVGIFKGESKVVVGADDGSLNIFNWGEYQNISDRFPGHPGSVECMQVISDDLVCTGCDDGKVRAVQLFPTRFLGVLGQHNGFPVESLSVSHDSSLLASSSHDQTIKFLDLSGIEDEKNEDVRNTKKKHFQLNKPVSSFFEDLA